MKRPVQPSLAIGDLAAGDVLGPHPVPSVIAGTNADLIRRVGPLYLAGAGMVVDVTYGRGTWWQQWRPDDLRAHDLATDGVDFRSLPYPDGCAAAVTFDPPYLPSSANGTGTSTVPEFRERFGLTAGGPSSRDAVADLMRAGVAECARILEPSGFLLVKACDYVEGAELVPALAVVFAAIDAVPMLRVWDVICHASNGGPGGWRTGETVHRSRRAHSYLIVARRRVRASRPRGTR